MEASTYPSCCSLSWPFATLFWSLLDIAARSLKDLFNGVEEGFVVDKRTVLNAVLNKRVLLAKRSMEKRESV